MPVINKEDKKTLYLNSIYNGIPSALDLINRLTTREKEILLLIAVGKRDKEIACYFNISADKVSQHKVHILNKLKLSNANELIHFAFKYKTEILKLC